ncbi:MAG: GAF domain-containing sensor histidine kinase [Armatimonadetes bacterium]|nr:GAF domain-containing sensor histidine kinase [Armatimonadota bacterium]
MDALTRRILQSDMVRSRTEERLNAELERLYVMQKLGNLINATFNLEQMLRVVSTSLVKEMNFDRVLLYLHVEGVDALACRTWQGFDVRHKDAVAPGFAAWLMQQAAETDQPRLSTLDDEELPPQDRALLERAGLFSVAVAPVFSRQELIGGIVAGRLNKEPAITQQDFKYFVLLANQMGIAIVNSRLYRRIEDYSRNLEREVSERTRELFSAYRELQESKETLVSSEKMAFLGQLTAGIAHEINTPIGAVLNSLNTLSELLNEMKASVDAPEVTAEDYREILGEMEQSLNVASSAIQKAARFVRGVKAQTRDLANVELRHFNPIASLEDISILLQHELKKSNVELEIDADRGSDFNLFGDAGKFSQIFTNLINNAIDAYEGKSGTITVKLYVKGSDVALDVMDRGCGITEENKRRLFHEMFTTKWQGKGTGLGLSIVYGLVTGAFGGLIDLESTIGQGTTFTVRLPRRRPEEVLTAAPEAPPSADNEDEDDDEDEGAE